MMTELADEAVSDEPEFGNDCSEAYRGGRAEGEALWDAWFAGACDTVDRVLAEPHETPSTGSTVATSRPGPAS